jgi:hypothetical protein
LVLCTYLTTQDQAKGSLLSKSPTPLIFKRLFTMKEKNVIRKGNATVSEKNKELVFFR